MRGTRGGKPLDDFQDDRTGDRGDDAATAAAAAAVGDEDDADDDEGEDEGPAAPVPGKGHNSGKTGNDLGSKADKLDSAVKAWEDQQAEIDAIMDEAKERCQPYKDEQKAIAKATAEGSETEPAIPKQVFKAAIIIRRHEAKKHRTLRKLNDDQRDELMALAETEGREGLVPLPLYEWAIEQKTKKKSSNRGARK